MSLTFTQWIINLTTNMMFSNTVQNGHTFAIMLLADAINNYKPFLFSHSAHFDSTEGCRVSV